MHQGTLPRPGAFAGLTSAVGAGKIHLPPLAKRGISNNSLMNQHVDTMLSFLTDNARSNPL
jgi:hypothetical protein